MTLRLEEYDRGQTGAALLQKDQNVVSEASA